MSSGIKKYIVFVIILILVSFLYYSHYITKEFSKEEEMISRLYGKFCSQATEEETSIIFDEIVQKINFPVIVTSPNGEIIAHRNVKETTKKMIDKLDKEHTPVIIEYEGKTLAIVHYGSSSIRKLLKFAPYIGVIVALILIFLGIFWLYTIRKTEEHIIFAGIAKETAHQLGTPISGLIGCKELISDDKVKNLMEEDLFYLQRVANRFHKIGSKVTFETKNLNEIISSVTEYLQKRISNKIKIVENYNTPIKVKLNCELFSWAIENIIKNAVDANSSEIIITTEKKNGKAIITIEDNGNGVPRNLMKKIFQPGFTTKEYGWGMGLSFVKRIVNIHKGKIFCKTNNYGTKFIIALPI